MKRLTLRKTWQLCMRMWEWIDAELRKNSNLNVSKLKRLWLEKHRYTVRNQPEFSCFFCEFAKQNNGLLIKRKIICRHLCPQCPGKLINRWFRCELISYDWRLHPHKFYQKLLKLNKKYKETIK